MTETNVVDLVINNGFVCTESGVVRGGLAIKDGVIVMVGADSTLPLAKKIYDAKSNFVFPGVIEPHCHFGVDQGGCSPEIFAQDIYSETRTAAQGGITTVCSTTLQSNGSLHERFETATLGMDHAYTDVRFYMSPFTDQNIEEIPEIMGKGVTNFKFLLAYRGEGARVLGIDEKGIDSTYMYKGFKKIAEAGRPAMAMVHCEDPEIFEYVENQVKSEGVPPYSNYIDAMNRARPAICEVIDLCKAAYIANFTQCPLYVVHISAKETVDQIAYFKSKGFNIIGETCPHYLLFSAEDIVAKDNEEWARFAKVNPPIRQSQDRDSLWQAIRAGTISTIGTDHLHYSLEMKQQGGYWEIPPGTGDGMSASLSIMISEGVNKNRISMDTLRKIMSENVAKAFGLYPQKGTLSVGADADVVIIDVNKEWTFSNALCETAHRYSLYEGIKLRGGPIATFLRGELVAKDFKIVGEKPTGQLITSYIKMKNSIGL